MSYLDGFIYPKFKTEEEYLLHIYRASRCIAEYYKWDNYIDIEAEKGKEPEDRINIQRKMRGYYNGMELHAKADLIIEATDVRVRIYKHTVRQENQKFSFDKDNHSVFLVPHTVEHKFLVYEAYEYDLGNVDVKLYIPPETGATGQDTNWEDRLEHLYKIAQEDERRYWQHQAQSQQQQVEKERQRQAKACNISPYRTGMAQTDLTTYFPKRSFLQKIGELLFSD